MERSMSGDHLARANAHHGVRRVRTKMSSSSVKINVFDETKDYYRRQYRNRSDNELAKLKCFEMSLRRRLSEKYCRHVARTRDRRHVQCVSSPNIFLSSHVPVQVVPCQKVQIRAPDEPYQDLRRAGIGECFKEQYTNYLEILDNIKTRPRMPSPVNTRGKAVRWSDNTNMARSASYDHLLTMRDACHCSCDTATTTGHAHPPRHSQSISDLVSVLASDQPQYDHPRPQQYDDPCQVWRQTRHYSHYSPGMEHDNKKQKVVVV